MADKSRGRLHFELFQETFCRGWMTWRLLKTPKEKNTSHKRQFIGREIPSIQLYGSWHIWALSKKVHERGFLCVRLWVCNEQSRLKLFLKWRKKIIFWLKFWLKFIYYIKQIHLNPMNTAEGFSRSVEQNTSNMPEWQDLSPKVCESFRQLCVGHSTDTWEFLWWWLEHVCLRFRLACWFQSIWIRCD